MTSKIGYVRQMNSFMCVFIRMTAPLFCRLAIFCVGLCLFAILRRVSLEYLLYLGFFFRSSLNFWLNKIFLFRTTRKNK